MAVEQKIREPMDQRPGRSRRHLGIGQILARAQGLQQSVVGAAGGVAQARVLEPQPAAEHEPKARRMGERETHVSLAHRVAGLPLQRAGQRAKSLLRGRREQRIAILEMTVGRVVRDARAARYVAQAVSASSPCFPRHRLRPAAAPDAGRRDGKSFRRLDVDIAYINSLS